MLMGIRVRWWQMKARSQLLRNVQVGALQAHREDQCAKPVHFHGVALAGPYGHGGVERSSFAQQVQDNWLAVAG